MTTCAKCGRVVTAYARIARDNSEGFIVYCQHCAAPIGAWKEQFIYRQRYIGPTPKRPMSCTCGAAAVAQCETCDGGFCERCWWKHSHTRQPAPIPAQGVAQ